MGVHWTDEDCCDFLTSYALFLDVADATRAVVAWGFPSALERLLDLRDADEDAALARGVATVVEDPDAVPSVVNVTPTTTSLMPLRPPTRQSSSASGPPSKSRVAPPRGSPASQTRSLRRTSPSGAPPPLQPKDSDPSGSVARCCSRQIGLGLQRRCRRRGAPVATRTGAF